MNYRHSFLTSILALLATSVSATILTPGEALSRFLSDRSGMAQRINGNGGQSRYALSYTEMDATRQNPAVYVFTNAATSEGFVVLAADDAAGNLLLGYSDSGAFDPKQIPCGLQWMLESYASRIGKTATGQMSPAAESEQRDAIAPLLKTKWDQGSPYNDKCPMVDGRRSVTGCVATAMAQVMKLYQWPTQGTGEHTYQFNYKGQNYSASADFGSTTYNWKNMRNTYTYSANTAQKNAVATLMLHCGVASDMNYSPEASGSSGFTAACGMLQYFDYDKSMKYLNREWFTESEWDDIVYEQLAMGQPVYYTGVTANREGHAFVCDGYDGSGYYHINWGWGGSSDGYFMLSNLDPDAQGIGGSAGNNAFNYSQSIMINIKPNEGSAPGGLLALGSEFVNASEQYNRNGSTTVTFNGVYYSWALVEIDYTIGLELVSASNRQYITYGQATLSPLYGIQGINIKANNFPVGEYDVFPVFKANDGEWQRMNYDKEVSKGGVHAVVTSTKIQFCELGDYQEPEIQDGTISAELAEWVPVEPDDSVFYAGHEYDFTYNLTTDGRWSGQLTCAIIDEYYNLHAYSDFHQVDFENTGSKTETFRVGMKNMKPGIYNACLAYLADDGYLYICSGGTPITLRDEPKPGDVDADGSFTINDIALTAEYLLETRGDGNGFSARLADMDGDGTVLVNDLTAIIALVLESGNMPTAPDSEEAMEETQDSVPRLEFSLKNEVPIRAYQFDMELPAGVEATIDKVGDTDHTIMVAEVGENKFRVLCYSLANSEYPVQCGNVMKVLFHVPEEYTAEQYVVDISNGYLSDSSNKIVR